MPPRPTKLSIAKEFRLKYGAEMPTAKLARIMYEECPECFTNIENARTTLRMIEGKLGEKKRPRDRYTILAGSSTLISRYIYSCPFFTTIVA